MYVNLIFPSFFYFTNIHNFNLRYYYADVNYTRKMVNKIISKGEWKVGEFSEMKQDLLNKLRIENKPNTGIL